MSPESARFFFDNAGSAAEGLRTILLDARTTTDEYSFSGLTIEKVLSSGILLQGKIFEVAAKLDKIPGALRYNE